jgi:hypothetical protein
MVALNVKLFYIVLLCIIFHIINLLLNSWREEPNANFDFASSIFLSIVMLCYGFGFLSCVIQLDGMCSKYGLVPLDGIIDDYKGWYRKTPTSRLTWTQRLITVPITRFFFHIIQINTNKTSLQGSYERVNRLRYMLYVGIGLCVMATFSIYHSPLKLIYCWYGLLYYIVLYSNLIIILTFTATATATATATFTVTVTVELSLRCLYYVVKRCYGTFMNFQWDILLLETGFISIFLALIISIPKSILISFSSNIYILKLYHLAYLFIILSCHLIHFRLLFGSGYVKITSGIYK